MLKFYGYDKCGTCRNARTWLDARGLTYQFVDITETPPPKALLRRLLKAFGRRALFNTSGIQYRELGVKDRLPGLTDAEVVDLLADNGRLCKRPMVTDGAQATVGFKDDIFEATWG